MNRLILFIVSACLFIGNAYADSNEDWYFTLVGTAPNQYIKITDAKNISTKTELVFPESIEVDGISYPVEEIAGNYFKNRTNIISVTFPSTLTTIGASLFEGCKGLTEITIPENVIKIGDNAFAETKIATLNWNAINCKTYENRGEYVESSHPFLRCPIKNLTLGDKVSVIPKNFLYNHGGLYYIDKLVIPENVTFINSSAFYNCRIKELVYNPANASCGTAYPRIFDGNITSLTISKNVKTLPAYLFEGLKQIRYIYAPTIPPACPDNTVFKNVDKVNCEVYVPKSSISTYKASVQWKEFTFLANTEYVDDTKELFEVNVIDTRSNTTTTTKIAQGTSIDLNLEAYNGFTHGVEINGKTYSGDNALSNSFVINEPTTIKILSSYDGIVDSPTILATENPINLHTPIFISSSWYNDGSGVIYYTKDGSEPDPENARVDPALVNGHADFDRAAGITDPYIDEGTFIYTGPFYTSLGGWFTGGKLDNVTIKSTVVRHKGSQVEMAGIPTTMMFNNLTTGVSGTSLNEQNLDVRGLSGAVEIMNNNGPVTVYDISGRIVSQGVADADHVRFEAPMGAVFVRCGQNIAKVIVN